MKKLFLVLFFSTLTLLGFSQKRHPYYGGGHHTSSHGGHYSGGHGSSNRGGHYVNHKTYNTYGRHKSYTSYRRRRH